VNPFQDLYSGSRLSKIHLVIENTLGANGKSVDGESVAGESVAGESVAGESVADEPGGGRFPSPQSSQRANLATGSIPVAKFAGNPPKFCGRKPSPQISLRTRLLFIKLTHLEGCLP
jgi:hypothetical protein